jgi:secondary thiamine-phosphate synthase enzyme
MTVFFDEIKIQSETRPTFHDITEKVAEILNKSKVENGIALVFSPHTTCSVLIQEESHDTNYHGTYFLMQDLVNIFEKLIPTCRTEGQYLHPGPKHIEAGRKLKEEASWSLNTDAHLRSVFLGRSESVPIIKGKLELGQFGRIYFADFDQVRARERFVKIQIVGE